MMYAVRRGPPPSWRTSNVNRRCDTRDVEVGILGQQAAVITHYRSVTVTKTSCRHGLARSSPVSWQKWPEQVRSIGESSPCGYVHAASLPFPGPLPMIPVVPRLSSLGEQPPA